MTAADAKYFFLCGILLHSLRKHFQGTPCFVMDIGLTEQQRAFFARNDMLLKKPAALTEVTHPYKLKSSLGLYLDERVTGTPVWIDSDVFAVRSGSDELAAVISAMQTSGQRIAMAPDEGPSRSIAGFIARYRAPKFALALSNEQTIAQRGYLNAGFVVFPDRAVLEEWRERSSLLEGDTCWEQNALNLIALESSCGMVLDARVWNVHAALLREVRAAGGEFQCAGERPIFVHATSASTSDVADEVTTLSRGHYSSEAYLRRFGNDALNREQHKLLNGFLLANADDLKDLQILRKSPAKLGRNDPCYCGSGKKFKNCHG